MLMEEIMNYSIMYQLKNDRKKAPVALSSRSGSATVHHACTTVFMCMFMRYRRLVERLLMIIRNLRF